MVWVARYCVIINIIHFVIYCLEFKPFWGSCFLCHHTIYITTAHACMHAPHIRTACMRGCVTNLGFVAISYRFWSLAQSSCVCVRLVRVRAGSHAYRSAVSNNNDDEQLKNFLARVVSL